MNKEKFLNKIDENLKTIPIIERMKIIQYFNEIIDDHIEDGLTEEQAILSLGDINDIVYGIIESEELKRNKIDNKNKAELKEQLKNLKEDRENRNFVLVNNDYNKKETQNNDKDNNNGRKYTNNKYQSNKNEGKEYNKSKSHYKTDDLNINIDINKILKKTENMVEKGMKMAKKAIDETDFNFDFDFSNTKENLVAKTYDSSNNIKDIIVEDINTGITVLESHDNNIHVKYYESEKEKYNIDEQNETLKIIKINENKSIFKWFNYKIRNKLELYLPKEFYGKAHISTNNSTIDVQNVNFNKINLKTSNGKISVYNTLIKENLDCVSSNGSINISKFICDNNTILKTSNGKINIIHGYGNNVNCKTSNSSIRIDNSNFDNDIELITSNGKIIFEELKVGNKLYCKTCNSSILGTIIDNINNFTVDSHTSNGKNTLTNNTNGNKILKCKTSNASIKVNFIDYPNEETNNK